MMFDLPWVATVWMPQDIGWHHVRDYAILDRFGLDDAANDKSFHNLPAALWLRITRRPRCN